MQTQTGRIKEILASDHLPQKGEVLVEVFNIGQNRHPILQAPVLCRPPEGQPHFILVKSTVCDGDCPVLQALNEFQDVLFLFSAQHDCCTVGCNTFKTVRQRQERKDSEKEVLQLQHDDDDHYVVNIFAIHNASCLRKAIGRDLTRPIPLYQDRRAHHNTSAAKLRTIRATDKHKRQIQKDAVAKELDDSSSGGSGDEGDDEAEDAGVVEARSRKRPRK